MYTHPPPLPPPHPQGGATAPGGGSPNPRPYIGFFCCSYFLIFVIFDFPHFYFFDAFFRLPGPSRIDPDRFSLIFEDSRPVSSTSYSKNISKWTPFSEQMCHKYRTCAQKIASRNSCGDSGDFPDSPEIFQTRPVRPWLLHAPGAKMTVVHTNSLKSEYKMQIS